MPKRKVPARVVEAQAKVDSGQVVMPELAEIALAAIDEPQLPSRETMDSDKMEELMESIKQLGLVQPISVQARGDRFEIMAGHRRFLAYKYLHKEFIPCFVYPEGYDGSDAVMLHENLVREELNPAQEAVFLAQLIERYKLSEDEICAKVKRSPGYVGDRVALLRGDALVFETLRAGRINFAVARMLNRFDNEEIRRYYLEHAARSGASARVVEDWLKQWRQQIAPALEAAKKATEATAALPPPENPVKCYFCGGDKDAYNLRTIWVHYWELQQIDANLKQLAEAQAQAVAASEEARKANGHA